MRSGQENQLLSYMQEPPYLRTGRIWRKKNPENLIGSHQPKIYIYEKQSGFHNIM
jgi:hypothetical protein